jgi:hypothetical protein
MVSIVWQGLRVVWFRANWNNTQECKDWQHMGVACKLTRVDPCAMLCCAVCRMALLVVVLLRRSA